MSGEVIGTPDPTPGYTGADANPALPPQPYSRFYQTRFRILVGLLAFSIVAGLPMAVVPALRHRLQSRVQVLKEALGGAREPKSIMARVGENTTPFPPEFERKIEPLKQPTFGGVLPLPNQVYTPGQASPVPTARGTVPALPSRPSAIPSQASTRRKLNIPSSRETTEPAADTSAEPEKGDRSSSEPQFGQGKVEREAYDLLIQSGATVSGMVRGSDPTLHFKDWAAAKMLDDSYLVRLNFVKDGAEVTYIWQVKLEAKQVLPLNFNARSLPKS